jgi:hypothetical protein
MEGQNSGLTEVQKQSLDDLLHNLFKFALSPEGSATIREIAAITNRIQSRATETTLTNPERQAYHFIRAKITTGGKPSVRDVARHLEFKSSRSAFKIIQSLISKSLVTKGTDGRITG